jgi:hypothetical protein
MTAATMKEISRVNAPSAEKNHSSFVRHQHFVVDLKRIVEAIEKSAQRDTQSKLDDFGFGETHPQAVEHRLRNALGVFRHGDRVIDHQPVDVVELRMNFRQHLDRLLRKPLHPQRFGVMADAIMAGVQLRSDDDGKFDVAPVDITLAFQVHQHLHDMRRRRRDMRHDRSLITERPVA